jgi:hypothetical protein
MMCFYIKQSPRHRTNLCVLSYYIFSNVNKNNIRFTRTTVKMNKIKLKRYAAMKSRGQLT